jgi:flavin-dependent dehydrogenase
MPETAGTFDAIIAGAGPAGCAVAYDLARAGRRVLLLDKRNFPRPKACACGLTRKTLAALRYSVEPVIERVCHEIILQQKSGNPAHREVRVHTRNPICAMAVRERFDAFCLQQTLAAGANGGSVHFRKIDSIVALREFAIHIELDIAFTTGGATQTETLTAPVLIGADGSNGQTRRLAEALATSTLSSRPETAHSAAVEKPAASFAKATAANLPNDPAWYARGFALEAMIPYTALPARLPQGDQPGDLVFDFTPIVGGYGWLFPKGDHINIGVGGFVPRADNDANNDRPHEKVTRTLLAEYTSEKLGVDIAAINAAITGQYLGLGGHNYIPRGRILLTGDAAGLVDPLTGEGIHSALISGQAAAAAILEAVPSHTNLSSRPEATIQTLSSRPEAAGRSEETRNSRGTTPGGPSFPASSERVGSNAAAPATALAAAYAARLQPLQETLAFSHRAACSFYATPERGFKVMRTPILRSLVLKTYADGLPHTKLLGALARRVA